RICDPVPHGFGISQRSVTVSSVGLVPAIRRLAGEGLSVTLAVSLHAPDDELRDELVPVNTRWKVAEVLDAARYYAGRTGRRVSVEYALIRDVNDQPWRAGPPRRPLPPAPRPPGAPEPVPPDPTPRRPGGPGRGPASGRPRPRGPGGRPSAGSSRPGCPAPCGTPGGGRSRRPVASSPRRTGSVLDHV